MINGTAPLPDRMRHRVLEKGPNATVVVAGVHNMTTTGLLTMLFAVNPQRWLRVLVKDGACLEVVRDRKRSLETLWKGSVGDLTVGPRRWWQFTVPVIDRANVTLLRFRRDRRDEVARLLDEP